MSATYNVRNQNEEYLIQKEAVQTQASHYIIENRFLTFYSVGAPKVSSDTKLCFRNSSYHRS